MILHAIHDVTCELVVIECRDTGIRNIPEDLCQSRILQDVAGRIRFSLIIIEQLPGYVIFTQVFISR